MTAMTRSGKQQGVWSIVGIDVIVIKFDPRLDALVVR